MAGGALVSRGEKFSNINPVWRGETVALIGGGPSLQQYQVDAVRAHGVRCIVINDAYLLAPWADALYFADARWHEWHIKGVARLGLTADQVRERYDAFAGYRIKIEQPGDTEKLFGDPRYYVLRNYTQMASDPLSERPDAVATGSASGYQALNIAYLAGATRVILLGYDASDTQTGKMHFFGDHPIPTSAAWLQGLPFQFQRIADALTMRGVEVINCSKVSRLSCFRKASIDSILCNPCVAPLPG